MEAPAALMLLPDRVKGPIDALSGSILRSSLFDDGEEMAGLFRQPLLEGFKLPFLDRGSVF